MGNFPVDRVRQARPFLICGVDFCGPFCVSLKLRGKPPIKTYVAVFVCFSSKAVHLELAVDLSTGRQPSRQPSIVCFEESAMPVHEVNCAQWSIPTNIELAYPRFYKPARVELLIGAEIFFELFSVGQIKLGSHHSSIQKTSLVYIVSGKYTQQALNSATHLSVTVTDNISSFDSLVERFWNLEQVTESSKAIYTAEQVACEQHFKETVKRLASGRFEVKLPFKRNPNVLGLSFETAKRRFLALERKRIKNS